MNEEQQKRFILFLDDFESVVKDCKGYLDTKDKVANIILKTFIEQLQTLTKELKEDIDFLNKEELSFEIEENERAYITNFIISIENDNNTMLNFISDKEEIEHKVYDVFFNDFLCNIRNLKKDIKI